MLAFRKTSRKKLRSRTLCFIKKVKKSTHIKNFKEIPETI
jgi:hypothetical protein